jgi:pilus assembly protein Flp/PilA
MTHNKRRDRGQSLIEYLIIVAVIAIGSISIVRSLGQTVYVRFANITNALQQKETSLTMAPITADQYQKKGLDDFFKGAASDGSKLP